MCLCHETELSGWHEYKHLQNMEGDQTGDD